MEKLAVQLQSENPKPLKVPKARAKRTPHFDKGDVLVVKFEDQYGVVFVSEIDESPRKLEYHLAFTRCLMLNGDGKYTEDCREFLECISQEVEPDEMDKDSENISEVYNEEQWDAVDAHITKYFGDYPNVFHEIISPDIHVDICVIPPSRDNCCDNEDGLCEMVMDGRYASWLALKAQLDENTAPSEQTQAMMRYLDCPCKYFEPTLDDDEIFAAYYEAAARGRKEGFVPLLVSAEDDTLWECLIMNSDDDREDVDDFSFDAEKVVAYRKTALETPLPKGEEVTALLLETRKEESEDDDMDWDEEVLGTMEGGEAQNRFIGYWDYETSATVPLILAEIPVQNPWQLFAYLPFGGWNDCPDMPELMAVTKYWYEAHGAVPAVMTHDVLEFALPRPVKRDNAIQLALEHYAWCPDVIDQGGDNATVGMLADALTRSKCWYFWWD